MKKLKYIGKQKLTISRLKSRGGNGLTLPLMDYNRMIPLSESDQIIELSENEAGDLQRCWPSFFVEVKESKKKKEEVIEDGN